jgi:hypothetical protein
MKVVAQQIGVTGKASIDASSGLFSKTPNKKTKEEGRKRATDQAWKKFKATNFSAPWQKIDAANPGALDAKVDTFCTFNYKEKFKKEEKVFIVKTRGSCDMKAIEVQVALLQGDGAQKAAEGTAAEGLEIAYLFIARRTSEAVQETSSTVGTKAADAAEGAQVADSESFQNVETQGNEVTQYSKTVEKAKEFKYEPVVTNAAMTEVASLLTSQGINAWQYQDFAGDCDGAPPPKKISNRYAAAKGSNNAFPAPDIKKIKKAAVACDAQHFAFGIMNVLQPKKESADVVSVTVQLQLDVKKYRGKRSSTCASVAMQNRGIGKDRESAEFTALKTTAAAGMQELIPKFKANCF